jgi:uncharacterized protein (DUF2141 family)
MNRYLLWLYLFCCSLSAAGQTPVKVRIDKLSGKTGTIYLAVYNNAATFLDHDKFFRNKITPVKDLDNITIDLGTLPKGNYAIALFLDENGNGKMDKNFMGIPKEKYGFSGSVRPTFRAPTFGEAMVHIDGSGCTVPVTLR